MIAGEHDTTVLAPNGQTLCRPAVYVDSTNDVALLRVQSLTHGAACDTAGTRTTR